MAMATVLVTKHAIDNWRMALETTQARLHCLKIFMKFGPQTAKNRTVTFTPFDDFTT